MVCHFWGHHTHPKDRPAEVFKGPTTAKEMASRALENGEVRGHRNYASRQRARLRGTGRSVGRTIAE